MVPAGFYAVGVPARPATTADLDAVVDVVALAFHGDPVWGPALRKPDGSVDHLSGFWRFFVDAAVQRGSLFVWDRAAAVAVWVPAGEPELTDVQQRELEMFIDREFPKERAAALAALFDRFDAAHPHAEPHATLSLLATHPRHRGRGVGQQLLAANLAELDARGVPSYLESTNPGNDHRYERAGFRRVGCFESLNGAPITTMWRPVAATGTPGARGDEH